MADPNVLAAQRYINAMYGLGIPENGQTGSVFMTGVIQAFQIENKVPNPTGYAGPYTIGVMKKLKPIKKMNVDDDSSRNVCLIQCALFGKGYNAGGITGIYYTTGVNAIKQLQSDAGFNDDGIIDWKVWAGLLSLNWFQTVSGGKSRVRAIQQQMNRDYVENIGVQACDGVISRNTALSVLAGLQVSLGILDGYIEDLYKVEFGDITKKKFTENVYQLMLGKDDSNSKIFTKIAQYGLYFNGCDPYTYNGTFDASTQAAVKNFQTKYGLLDIGLSEAHGVIGASTIASLMASKGDTSRSSRACDCSTILNATQAKDLKNSRYSIVGRYLTGTVGIGASERDKSLSKMKLK